MLYGRDDERARITELLEGARSSRSGVLVVRGEAGIGKTALLEDARDRASDMHVLSARGVESESELTFAGLHQLLRPALHLVERLPGPQAAALNGSLGLEDTHPRERFLVFAACLSLLSELAERRPVLCLVDDAHWLDESSADALQFIGRRLDAEGIVLLFGARSGDLREFEAPDLPSLTLQGLDAEAAARLLARSSVDVPPSVRDHLLAQTRGNALALVEVPSALSAEQLAGTDPLPDALPMTQQLERVFHERVVRLPEMTRLVLLVAAADDSEDVSVVNRAAGALGADERALSEAERAGLVVVHGGRLTFRHPLVRSAVYRAAMSGERRAAHNALAVALADDESSADRRAWHLASSVVGPDDGAIEALDAAARRAEGRAAFVAAARAFERAAELSSAAPERGERLVHAARNLSLAGRNEEALTRAGVAAPLVEDPRLRAAIAEVRGIAAIRSGRPGDVVHGLIEAAREVAKADPAKAVDLLMDASIAAWQGGNRAAYLEIARQSATIEPPADDETSTMLVRSIGAFAAMATGDTAGGVEVLRELVAWGATAEDSLHTIWAAFGSFWLGDATVFGTLVERAAGIARQRGELGTLTEALGMRSAQLAFEQRFDAAEMAAGEAVELARALGAVNLELLPGAALAIVAAMKGHDDEARRLAEEVQEQASASGLPLRASGAIFALALADLAYARWPEALQKLQFLAEGEAAAIDPMALATIPDRIEAAVRAGQRDEAEQLLPLLEERVAYSGLRAMQPRLAACRGLLSDGDEATAHFEAALSQAEDARPFDLARIRLLFGEHLRRERRRSDARPQLRAALEAFERIGAEPWADRARTELRASGETTRKRDPSTVSQLTPQEVHVARLVAEGLSNKEIAAQLFLSPRTIDSHLRNVFSKLGITSRTQLARLAAGEQGSGPATQALGATTG